MRRTRRTERAKGGSRVSAFFENAAGAATQAVGSSWGFGIAFAVVLVWGVTGPIFGFSDTWQLVINTGTTIVTFLMVFLIQRTQNKDGLAVQIKLNELIAAIEGASNRLIDVEDLSEDELKVLEKHFRRLAEMAENEGEVARSHSVDEADSRHFAKHKRRSRSA